MENPPVSSMADKILQAVAVTIVVASFLTSLLELPPATFLIKYYCSIFDTDRYSPIVIGGIMVIVGLLPILLIKKIMAAKKKESN
jgi:hypothetical protein